jgi:tripartite-type tricarboxylate transporter receptor subunit TctC
MGQPVVVDIRAAGIVADFVAKAPSDGYTLMVNGGVVWIAPFLQKVSYDPVRDFLPISRLSTQPTVLVAHPSLPVKSVREFVALAKAKPGELN